MVNKRSRVLWVLICVMFLVIATMPVIASGPQSDTDDGFKGVDAKGVKEAGIKKPGGGKKAQVKITAPTDGDVVSGVIDVSVTTELTIIVRVEFYLDGVWGFTDDDPNDGWTWVDWDTTGADDGQHVIAAQAWDSHRLKGTGEISVTVDNDPDRWAVVIGIADYKGRSNDLQYTDDDAIDMNDYLLSVGYSSSNIMLLIDNAAKGNAIYDAIDWMGANEGPNDECVFFYSGHGSTYDGYDDGDGEYTDEAIVCWELKLILDGFLRDAFSVYDSEKIAFIFDSCFSGGMNDLAGAGRVVVAACGETQLSFDGASWMENGVFTYYYMIGLDTYDTVEGAFAYAEGPAHVFVWNNYGYAMDPQMDDQYDGDWTF